MSTEHTGPTEPNRAGPVDPNVTAPGPVPPAPVPPVAGHPAPGAPESAGSEPTGPDGDAAVEPGWITRNTTLLIALMAAIVVAGGAVLGVALYRNHTDGRDADTEKAFRADVTAKGAEVETVECSGDTCSAIINGQAYTVLVQEDADGDQHFGVSAFTGR